MLLPKIAALYEGSKPDINSFSETLQQFFSVFTPDYLNASEGIPNLYKYDALIMRPKWGGILRDESFNIDEFEGAWNSKFQIATFSVSDSKIQLTGANAKKADVTKADYGNLDSTAELAIWMAMTLRRKLHLHCMSLSQGCWQNESISKGLGLKRTRWAILGMGNLGSRVLARLPGLGVSEIKVFYDKPDTLRKKGKAFINNADPEWMSDDWKKQGWENQESTYERIYVCGNPGYDRNGTIAADRQVSIEISTDIFSVISNVDVVCLSLPYTREGNRSTEGFIKKEHLEKLNESTVFINVSRAEIISKDAYESLFDEASNGEMKLNPNKCGFGSDVIAEHCENKPYTKDNKYQTHRIWAAFSSSMFNIALLSSANPSSMSSSCITHLSCGASPPIQNVILTPHIGGATVESEEAIADEVIVKLLENLGIHEKYEVFLKRKAFSTQEGKIELSADEKVLCYELLKRGYDLGRVWRVFINGLAEVILSAYDEDDKEIRMQKKDGIAILPCNWKFERRLEHESKTITKNFSVNEEFTIDGHKTPLDGLFPECIFTRLLEYTTNGSPIALSDWIRFALRMLYTITSRCEDRGEQKSGWILQKGNRVSNNWEPLHWQSIVDPPETRQPVMNT